MESFQFKIILGVIITGLVTFLGGWDMALITLVTLICIDYVTGVIAAIASKTLSSYSSLTGLCKKVLELLLVAFAATLDSFFGLSDPYVRTTVITILVGTEGISIAENMERGGLPVPAFLKNLLKQTQEKGGN